jgi:hypothetical protein
MASRGFLHCSNLAERDFTTVCAEGTEAEGVAPRVVAAGRNGRAGQAPPLQTQVFATVVTLAMGRDLHGEKQRAAAWSRRHKGSRSLHVD